MATASFYSMPMLHRTAVGSIYSPCSSSVKARATHFTLGNSFCVDNVLRCEQLSNDYACAFLWPKTYSDLQYTSMATYEMYSVEYLIERNAWPTFDHPYIFILLYFLLYSIPFIIIIQRQKYIMLQKGIYYFFHRIALNFFLVMFWV